MVLLLNRASYNVNVIYLTFRHRRHLILFNALSLLPRCIFVMNILTELYIFNNYLTNYHIHMYSGTCKRKMPTPLPRQTYARGLCLSKRGIRLTRALSPCPPEPLEFLPERRSRGEGDALSHQSKSFILSCAELRRPPPQFIFLG